MTKMPLGRLQRIELRKAWETEAGEFTPWLAQEDNIKLLGEALDLDLEVEAQEKNVGPFRADILCKDTATGHWVLIENQLQRTDHTHLGQILTYAAGLQAVTIVWIAERFTDEHRAAIDWLNEVTTEEVNFFGLEIELWRIGDSPIAPKFNVVSKPNDWTKRPGPEVAAATPTKQLNLAYWTAFKEFALQKKTFLRIQKPLPQHWTNFGIGKAYVYMNAVANTRDKEIFVGLILDGPYAKPRFKMLAAQREDIEAEAKAALEWRELPHRKQSQVILTKSADPSDQADWPNQHDWLLRHLELFHRVFSQRVKNLPDEELSEVTV